MICISRTQSHTLPTLLEKGERAIYIQCVPSLKLLNQLQFMFSSFIDFSKWPSWLCVCANERKSYFTTAVYSEGQQLCLCHLKKKKKFLYFFLPRMQDWHVSRLSYSKGVLTGTSMWFCVASFIYTHTNTPSHTHFYEHNKSSWGKSLNIPPCDTS